jgi:uncharacterized protein DUF4388
VSLSGNLGSFSLDEVLRLLAHTTKSGALHVRDGETEGVLYLVDGRLNAAELDAVPEPVEGRHGLELRLVDAIFTLGRLPEGAFEFEPDRAAPWAGHDTIEVECVLERIRGLRSRWPAIERLIPSLDAPVALVARLRDETVTLDRETWAAVASIDGRRSVRSVALAMGDSAFEVAAALAPLVAAGAVAIDAVEREPITDGVFERGSLAAAIDALEAIGPATIEAVDVQPAPAVVIVDSTNSATDHDNTVDTKDAVDAVDAVYIADPGDTVDTDHADEPDVAEAGVPVTEGPEALARLNRAELERAALGEPAEAPEPHEHDGTAAVVRPDADGLPAVRRDRGSLLRMFSTLRDG